MIRNAHTRSAFTLVELAIVLVIIGLIVGGVLVGQDLIQAAKLRSVASDINQYNTAVYTFRDKYGGLPGDLLNTKAAAFGFNTTASDAARDGTEFKGDGSGLIYGCSALGDRLGCEMALFWVDLSKAGLIPMTATLTSITATAQLNKTVDQLAQGILPKTKLRDNVLIGIYSNRTYNNYIIGNLGTVGGPGFLITSSVWQNSGGLTPLEALYIDTKLDDGQPLRGIMTSGDMFAGFNIDTAGGGSECVAANGSYNTSTDALANAIVCALSIRAPF